MQKLKESQFKPHC